MLVMSRKPGETIHIGDEIVFKVLETRGDKVRIGVSAPSTVAVHRGEIYEAIRQKWNQGESGKHDPEHDAKSHEANG